MNKPTDKTLNKRIIKLFAQYSWRYKGYVAGTLISVPLRELTFKFLPPLVLASILSKISHGQYIHGDIWHSFGPALVAFLLLNTVGGIILGRLINLLVWKLEMSVAQDMHQNIFDHLMQLSANFHANRFSGSLVSQANKFSGAYERSVDTTVYQVIPLILSFVFTVVILAPKVPAVAAFLVIFSIIFMLVSAKITKKVRDLNAIEAARSTQQTGALADAVTNVTAIKSFARERFEQSRYGKATRATRNATTDVMQASLKREVFFSSSTVSLESIALLIAVASVVLFDANIATVYLVATYAGIISENLWTFSQSTLKNYNRALGDAAEMTEIFAIEPAIKDPTNPQKPLINKGTIEFSNMTFTHTENHDALFHKLNLNIKAGEKIGLIGRSGGGKTTLTKLLLRFSDVDGGTIKIDGQDISKITQEGLRDNITYVPQEPMLFHRSLAENIGYGQPGADNSKVVEVAKMAHAHEFIEKLPKGYDTLVGERGVKLSGGQRQRVAIARAMIKDAPILVLDEATSALDSESEGLIQDALWKLMEGRTAIVIAHRLSTIQRMDRIIVLENGQIVEQGTHKELIQKQGEYAKLWNHQSGGFIDE